MATSRGNGDMVLGPEHTTASATCRIEEITGESMDILVKALV